MTDFTNPALQYAHDVAATTSVPLDAPGWLLEAAEACIEDTPQDANAVELAHRVMAFVRELADEWCVTDQAPVPCELRTSTLSRVAAIQTSTDPDERVARRFVSTWKRVTA